MRARVTDLILEELDYRVEIEEEEGPDEFPTEDVETIKRAIATIRRGERPTGAELNEVESEILNMAGYDRFSEGRGRRELNEAAAFLGILDRYDPRAIYSGGRPKTITIDGVTYERL